jgi:prepilin-type processing-associated H-X9-DG protein
VIPDSNTKKVDRFGKLLPLTALSVALGTTTFIGIVSFNKTNASAHDSGRHKAQEITCVNNLKMVGLCLRDWAGDNNELCPWNISTNKGGSLELCVVDKGGFDSNTTMHFQIITNVLTTPKLLVCPQDRSRKPAVNWQNLTSSNVTYRLRTSTNVNLGNPKEVIAVCPIDGNILWGDGHVTEGKTK